MPIERGSLDDAISMVPAIRVTSNSLDENSESLVAANGDQSALVGGDQEAPLSEETQLKASIAPSPSAHTSQPAISSDANLIVHTENLADESNEADRQRSASLAAGTTATATATKPTKRKRKKIVSSSS